MYKSGSRTCLVVPSIKHCLYCSCAYVCHPQHNQSKLYIAPIFPFLISSPSILFISDDEEEKDVIIIEDSDGGYTHVYISSDEENDAVYGNDGASYANTKDVCPRLPHLLPQQASTMTTTPMVLRTPTTLTVAPTIMVTMTLEARPTATATTPKMAATTPNMFLGPLQTGHNQPHTTIVTTTTSACS